MINARLFPVLTNDRDIGIGSAIQEDQLIIDIAQVCLVVCIHATRPASLQLQLLLFPSLASLCAPSSSVPSSSLPHDTSASSSLQRTIPHLQSARGGRYTRSVHACDNLRAAAVISLTCHTSHLSYVSLMFTWFHPWPVESMAYVASASCLEFLMKSPISTQLGRLGESVATVMEA